MGILMRFFGVLTLVHAAIDREDAELALTLMKSEEESLGLSRFGGLLFVLVAVCSLVPIDITEAG